MCLWFPWLKISLLFLITKAGKVSKLWQALHWNFLQGTESFLHELNLHTLNAAHCSGGHSWYQSIPCAGLTLEYSHYDDACGLIALTWEDFFFLCFPVGSSVCWCLSRLICAACGSPATCLIWHVVSFELSIHFASCSNFACWELV